MLYERFWYWLTFHNRRHCKHENEVTTGKTKIDFGYFDEVYEIEEFKCTNCGRKKKRTVLDVRDNIFYR